MSTLVEPCSRAVPPPAACVPSAPPAASDDEEEEEDLAKNEPPPRPPAAPASEKKVVAEKDPAARLQMMTELSLSLLEGLPPPDASRLPSSAARHRTSSVCPSSLTS